MVDKVRSQKQSEEYLVQPADGVRFIRHDLSQAELKEARQRIRDGESIDSVVDDFAAKIAAKKLSPSDYLTRRFMNEPKETLKLFGKNERKNLIGCTHGSVS